MSSAPHQPPPATWPYFRTPLSIFLAVMLPINGLMLFLLINRTPAWTKATAALVIAGTLYAACRGYVRRLSLSADGATLVQLTRRVTIPWSQVRQFGSYVPGGGVGATEYFYITRRDRPPAGKWDIDADTIQVQARPGLSEAVEHFRANAAGGADSLN